MELIEARSIDYVPVAERHGGLASQFSLWLAANLQITAIVTGALAVIFGGDVFWSLIALLAGQLIGGTVMALHAAQGPQLGLPQMISSRVQFGVYGAVIGVVTVFGYRVIHRLGRIASIIGVLAFLYMFSRLWASHGISALLAARHFSLDKFLLSMSLSASWQIAS